MKSYIIYILTQSGTQVQNIVTDLGCTHAMIMATEGTECLVVGLTSRSIH